MAFLQDDLIDIKCYVCGEVISSGPNMGFNTAKCDKCQKGDTIVQDAQPLETRNDIDTRTFGERIILLGHKIRG